MSTFAVKTRTVAFRDFDEIKAMLAKFEDGSLPCGQWTHAAHLTVACWYLLCYTEEEAARRVREGIQSYNKAQGIVTTKERGYHETMTYFWTAMVRSFLSKTTIELPIVHLFNLLVANYEDKHLPFTYYSRDRLLSWEARQNVIEPDLKPLP